MDTVYPPSASALARGRRLRRAEPRLRQRTTPVTFAEIKEVDEETAEAEVCGERRRPDVLEERLGRQFAEFRRRRARRDLLREHESPPPPAPHGPPHGPPLGPPHGSPHGPPHSSPHGLPRAGSEPAALHRQTQP